MRRFPFVLACAAVLVTAAPAAYAGLNAGCSAYATWTPTSLLTDVPPAASRSVYVIITSATASPLSYKGAEIDLTWAPTADCFTHGSTFISTSTNCAWLNRGTSAPVTTIDIAGHYHVLWSNTLVNSTCTSGTAIRVQFDTSLCTAGGCLSLNQVRVLDANNAVDTAVVTNAILTIAGGGGQNCAATPTEPASWGRIKGLYRI